MAKAAAEIANARKRTPTTMDDYITQLKSQGILDENAQADYDEKEGSWVYNTTSGHVITISEDKETGEVTGVDVNGKEGQLPEIEISNIALSPRTSSIQVNVTGLNIRAAKYTYYYTPKDGSTVKYAENVGNSILIENLQEDTEYTIKVVATNKNGTAEKEAQATTTHIVSAVPVTEFSAVTWNSGKASITITNNNQDSSYTMKYKLEEPQTTTSQTTGKYSIKLPMSALTYNEWITVERSVTLTDLKVGTKISVILTDGTYIGDAAIYTITDTTAPTVGIIEPQAATAVGVGQTINARVVLEDRQSGISLGGVSYTYSGIGLNGSVLGTVGEVTVVSGPDENGRYEVLVPIVADTVGEYKLTVKARDLASPANFSNDEESLEITVNPPDAKIAGADKNLDYTVEWVNGNGNIDIESITNYEFEYSRDNGEHWTTSNQKRARLINVTKSEVIHIRLIEETYKGKIATIQLSDDVGPTVTVTNQTADNPAVKGTTVRATLRIVDDENGSGVDFVGGTYKFEYTDALGTTTDLVASQGIANGNVIEVYYANAGVGTYKVKGTAKDYGIGSTDFQAQNAITVNPVAAVVDSENANITYTTSWAAGKTTLTLTKAAGFTEYDIAYNKGNGWVRSNIVEDLSAGDQVQVKFVKGTNPLFEGQPTTITVEDAGPPSATISEFKSNTTEVGATISAQVEMTDSGSGIDFENSTYQIIYTDTNGAVYTQTATQGNIVDDTITVTYTANEIGKYKLRVVGQDNSGNRSSAVISTNEITINPKTATIGTSGTLITYRTAWNATSGKATVTLETNENCNMKYNIGFGWSDEITSGTVIQNVTSGTTLNVMFSIAGYDGLPAGDGITIADSANPTAEVVSVSPASGRVGSTISAQVRFTDLESGINWGASSYKIVYTPAAGSGETAGEYDAIQGAIVGDTRTITYVANKPGTYAVKVTAVDNANKSSAAITGAQTVTINPPVATPNVGGNLTYTVGWLKTANSANVTLTNTSGLSMKYSKDNGANWTTATTSATVTGVVNGGMVLVRFLEGSEEGQYATITVQDNIAPTASISGLSSYSINAGAQISATVSLSDADSGPNTNESATKYKYEYTNTSGGTTIGDLTLGAVSNNTRTVSIADAQPGTYVLKITPKDWAGNTGTTATSDPITVTQNLNQPVTGPTGTVGATVTYDVEWPKTSNNAKVTLNTTSGYNMKYSTYNGTTWSNWSNEVTDGYEISGIANNTSIRVKFVSGSLESNYNTITIIDDIKPTVTITEFTSTTGQKGATLNAKITFSDADSGPNYDTLTYVFKCIDQNGYETSQNGSFVKREGDVFTITGTADKVGKYKLYTAGSDWGGSGSIEAVSSEMTINPTTLLASDVTWGDVSWTGAIASVTLTKNNTVAEEYTLQYKKGSSGTWTDIPDDNTITDIADETVIYARFVVYDRNGSLKFEGAQGTQTNATLTVVDNTGPNIEVTSSSYDINKGTQITITINTSDTQGVTNIWYTMDSNSANIAYPSKGAAVGDAWNATSAPGYVTKGSATTSTKSFNVTINKGQYAYVHVLAKDSVGNYTSATSGSINVHYYANNMTASSIATNISNGTMKSDDVYGKRVEYSVTPVEGKSSFNNWQIFLVDTPIGLDYCRILISSSSIATAAYVPSTSAGVTTRAISGGLEYEGAGVVNYYDGLFSKIKYTDTMKLLHKYGNVGVSGQLNLKITEFLLDTDVWNIWSDGTLADWAIGAPTYDLFIQSYSNTHKSNNLTLSRKSSVGYAYSGSVSKTRLRRYVLSPTRFVDASFPVKLRPEDTL